MHKYELCDQCGEELITGECFHCLDDDDLEETVELEDQGVDPMAFVPVLTDKIPAPRQRNLINLFPQGPLEVGQSFFYPVTRHFKDQEHLHHSATYWTQKNRKRHSGKYSIRKVSEAVVDHGPELPGVRVWRVE